jgi:hypothetical protein
MRYLGFTMSLQKVLGCLKNSTTQWFNIGYLNSLAEGLMCTGQCSKDRLNRDTVLVLRFSWLEFIV